MFNCSIYYIRYVFHGLESVGGLFQKVSHYHTAAVQAVCLRYSRE